MQLPGEFSPFIERKVVFCLVVRPLKKTLFFMCVFPKLSVLVKYCKKSVIFSDKMFPCEVSNTHFKEKDTLVGM